MSDNQFFRGIERDERDDWRKHPVTVLAREMLRDHVRSLEHEALTALRDGNDSAAKVKAGEAAGVGFALDLLERD